MHELIHECAQSKMTSYEQSNHGSWTQNPKESVLYSWFFVSDQKSNVPI